MSDDRPLCGCGHKQSLHQVDASLGGVYCQLAALRAGVAAGAACPPQPEEPQYTEEEVAILRADFEQWLIKRNVDPEIRAFLCYWSPSHHAAASRPRPQEGEIQQALDALHDYGGLFSRSTDNPDELIVTRELHGLLCDLWLASRKGAASPPPQEPDK